SHKRTPIRSRTAAAAISGLKLSTTQNRSHASVYHLQHAVIFQLAKLYLAHRLSGRNRPDRRYFSKVTRLAIKESGSAESSRQHAVCRTTSSIQRAQTVDANQPKHHFAGRRADAESHHLDGH